MRFGDDIKLIILDDTGGGVLSVARAKTGSGALPVKMAFMSWWKIKRGARLWKALSSHCHFCFRLGTVGAENETENTI